LHGGDIGRKNKGVIGSKGKGDIGRKSKEVIEEERQRGYWGGKANGLIEGRASGH